MPKTEMKIKNKTFILKKKKECAMFLYIVSITGISYIYGIFKIYFKPSFLKSSILDMVCYVDSKAC